jgi:uncharacterized YigZ family protein
MVTSYKTIACAAEGFYKEKGSKFLGFAFPVSDEEEIKNILNDLRKKHHDARHHCYAFRLGADGKHYRANDDQEPSGTAGKPIHGQLLSFEVTKVLLVVVRYFGGTKLGASGLIQAYKTAAQDALEHAEIISRDVEVACTLSFPYERYNEVMRSLRESKARILSQQLDNISTMEIALPLQHLEMAKSKWKYIPDLSPEIQNE